MRNPGDRCPTFAQVAGCSLIEWSGTVWRCFNARRNPYSSKGSWFYSGRYNCGTRPSKIYRTLRPVVRKRWRALYLALDPTSCVVEVQRHTDDPRTLNHILARYEAHLYRVLDFTDPIVVGHTYDLLCRGWNYRYAHRLAYVAMMCDAEAVLVPAATHERWTNVVFFPQFRTRQVGGPHSTLRLVDKMQPYWHLN